MGYPEFMNGSSPLHQTLATIPITGFGERKSFNLNNVGYCAGVALRIKLQFTATAVGNFDVNFFPHNILSNINVVDGSGFTYHNHSSYENVTQLQVQFPRGTSPTPDVVINPNNLRQASGTGNYSTSGWQNAHWRATRLDTNAIVEAGASIAATTYSIGGWIWLPFSTGDFSSGLQLLQNTNSVYTVNLTVAQFSDYSGGASVISAVTGSIVPVQYCYAIPALESDRPYPMASQGDKYRFISNRINWTASGEQVYNLPLGNQILYCGAAFKNVSSSRFIQLVPYSTANDPSSNVFTTAKVIYGGTQTPISVTCEELVHNYRERTNRDPVDGLVPYDFAHMGAGVPYMSPMGILNTQNITNASVNTTCTTTPASGAVIDYFTIERVAGN
jgi:hypothetical protein